MVVDVRVGSRDETEANGGIAHFLEHYVHSGTRRWNVAEIAKMRDRLGGYGNATTTREHTRYYRETLPDQFDASLELLAETTMHPSLPPERLEVERQVVLRENKGRDEPLMALWERLGVGGIDEGQLLRRLFSGSTLYQHPSGATSSLSTIDVPALRAFHQTHYRPNNATVVVSGGIDPAGVKAAVERYFGDWPSGTLPDPPTSPAPAESLPIRIVQRGAVMEHQGEIWVGARTVSADDGQQVGLDVLAQLLQRRLHERLRTQEGLVYAVFAEPRDWSDAGEFRIGARAAPEHLARIEAVIGEELAAIASQTVSAEELDLAKRVVLTTRALRIDRNLDRAFELLERNGDKGGDPPPDFRQQIDAVRADAIQGLARTYLGAESRYTVLHQPWMTGRRLRWVLAVVTVIVAVWLTARRFLRRRAAA
jgi:predicted Zn-dependent peptidase